MSAEQKYHFESRAHSKGGVLKLTDHICCGCLYLMPRACRCKLGHICYLPCEDYEDDSKDWWGSCPQCGGIENRDITQGNVKFTSSGPCPVCGGSGYKKLWGEKGNPTNPIHEITCPDCHGTGKEER